MSLSLRNTKYLYAFSIIVLLSLNVFMIIKYIKALEKNHNVVAENDSMINIRSLIVEKYGSNSQEELKIKENKIFILLDDKDCLTCIKNLSALYQKHIAPKGYNTFIIIKNLEFKEKLFDYYYSFNKMENVFSLIKFEINADEKFHTPCVMYVDGNDNILCKLNITAYNQKGEDLFLERLNGLYRF